MTSHERLIVARLLSAIEEADKPIPFTVSLPPHDWRGTTTAVNQERDRRNAAKAKAIAEAKALIFA